ncbi:hypothetical protein KC669_00360, partial [Candidatus Dojkabacteria bacterium]|nr:hypothetical protein [Candidatus Dojkabacteria bacterium]
MKQNWNLQLIADPKDFKRIREEVKKATDELVSKWENETSWLENPSKTKEALDDLAKWSELYGEHTKEFFYHMLLLTLDEGNTEVKAKYNQIHKLAVATGNQVNFFTIRLSKISTKMQRTFLESQDLKEYKHYLERLFRTGKHTLSEAEEKIMLMKSKVSSENWIQMLSAMLAAEEREVTDEKGGKSMKSFSQILELMSDRNKTVRDKAAKVFNELL